MRCLVLFAGFRCPGAPMLPAVWLLVLPALLWLSLPGPRAGWGEELPTGPLLRQLEEGTTEVRRHALVELAEHGDTATVPKVAAALRDTDPITRRLAERALWSIWSRSGDEDVDELMKTGTLLLTRGNPAQSVAVFGRIIELAPDFPEGYNKRATAYYHIGEFEKSLQDISQTLRRNPYHFGALSGAGLCLVELERFDEAVGYFDRALKINPNLQGIVELRKAILKRSKKPVI